MRRADEHHARDLGQWLDEQPAPEQLARLVRQHQLIERLGAGRALDPIAAAGRSRTPSTFCRTGCSITRYGSPRFTSSSTSPFWEHALARIGGGPFEVPETVDVPREVRGAVLAIGPRSHSNVHTLFRDQVASVPTRHAGVQRIGTEPEAVDRRAIDRPLKGWGSEMRWRPDLASSVKPCSTALRMQCPHDVR